MGQGGETRWADLVDGKDVEALMHRLSNRCVAYQNSFVVKTMRLFSLHELLLMAALGGVLSSALSWIRMAVGTLIPLPGAMQWAAGLHKLWLVLAVGPIRKPGAALLRTPCT